jgi:cell fate (sporulation/competence/biofilm development) regulator YlbF (YheA/YmcA/DUF963 family)
MQKEISNILEKIALKDKKVKKLLNSHKAVQTVIKKIREIIYYPISDEEKITEVGSVIDNFEKLEVD